MGELGKQFSETDEWLLQGYWGLLGVALIIYALSGGADYGAGVLSFLARGPEKQAIKDKIRHAIGPIWEANHVWLIFMIVVLFSVFSPAFAQICIGLHLPLSLILLGIVLRGSALIFRSYGLHRSATHFRWEWLFGVSSLMTPFLLGTVPAALCIGWAVGEDTVSLWLNPFVIASGFLCLCLLTMLAACYLIAESEGEVRAFFRREALIFQLLSGGASLITLFCAWYEAPHVVDTLLRSSLAYSVQLVAALCAAMIFASLYWERYRWLRLLAMTQITLVIFGWGAVMDGELIWGTFSLKQSVADPAILLPMSIAIGIGSLILFPALYFLFYVFKSAKHSALKH